MENYSPTKKNEILLFAGKNIRQTSKPQEDELQMLPHFCEIYPPPKKNKGLEKVRGLRWIMIKVSKRAERE